jgi:hypothetical protein
MGAKIDTLSGKTRNSVARSYGTCSGRTEYEDSAHRPTGRRCTFIPIVGYLPRFREESSVRK